MSIWKIILILLLIPVLYVGGQLLFGTLTDYKPKDVQLLNPVGEASGVLDTSQVTLYIWNIGYAGLGMESDFFYDGGEMTRATREWTDKNLTGIKETIGSWDDADLVLLQEVDEVAKRSYKVNQFEEIREVVGQNFSAALAYNYVVKFVVKPWFKPLGQVRAGLATYFRFKASEISRYQFPGNFEWPKRIYFLDRCFMVTRIPYGESELVVINTHNSAYDDGTLKRDQMNYLKDFIVKEYESGNYVIVGGDWNQCPPQYNCYGEFSQEQVGYEQFNIDRDFMPEGWLWAYDPSVRTNRKLSTPYQSGQTFTTIIDFYLVSPNVKVLKVEGQDQDFKYSDHQAVKLQVELE